MTINIDRLYWILNLSLENKECREKLREDLSFIPNCYEIPDELNISYESIPNCEIGEKINIVVEGVGTYKGIVKGIFSPKEIREQAKEEDEVWENFKDRLKTTEARKYLDEAEEDVLHSYLLKIQDIEYREVI